eukprot:9496173-Pyramimonas_sp.AAC.1
MKYFACYLYVHLIPQDSGCMLTSLRILGQYLCMYWIPQSNAMGNNHCWITPTRPPAHCPTHTVTISYNLSAQSCHIIIPLRTSWPEWTTNVSMLR